GARTGRSPTPEEREGLVQRWLEEEIMVRRAQSLNLHQGDPILRRRLAQVMRFVWEESAGREEPSDAILHAWWSEHRERYAGEPRVELQHVFFSRERRGGAAMLQAREQVASLADQDNPPAVDPFLHGMHITGASPRRLG